MKDKKQYMTIHPKVHAHIILTQMNIRERLQTIRKKGNEAILKELKQLHDKKALMPIQKTCHMMNKRKL